MFPSAANTSPLAQMQCYPYENRNYYQQLQYPQDSFYPWTINQNNSSTAFSGFPEACDNNAPLDLTPTTMKSIHQSILQTLGEEAEEKYNNTENEQCSGSFVPPLPPPTLSFRQKILKRWQEETEEAVGGVVTAEQNWSMSMSVENDQNMKPGKPSTKRKSRQEDKPSKRKTISENDNLNVKNELSRLLRRREKNKLAAARCRKRRADRTTELQEETERLEAEKRYIQAHIREFQAYEERLKSILENHQCDRRVAPQNRQMMQNSIYSSGQTKRPDTLNLREA